ncbi:MAG: hypothetical protein ABH817_00755 [archaeon]
MQTVSPFSFGLMFQTYNSAHPIQFIFKKPRKVAMTTLFCFFPILMLFYNGKKLVDKRAIAPFNLNISVDKPVTKIIEIPLTKKEFVMIKEGKNLLAIEKLNHRGRKL